MIDTTTKILVCAIVPVLIAPGLVLATTIHIEAEFFTNSHNYAGDTLSAVPASSCSGGYLLTGLDHTGEWTEYALPIDVVGNYSATMRCRGDFGVPYHFLLVVNSLRSTSSQTVDFSFTGNGYG